MEVFQKVFKHKELVFVACALASTIISIFFYILVYRNEENVLKTPLHVEKKDGIPTNNNVNATVVTIYADISGSIKNPGVYSFKDQARIKDIFEAAGGFNTFADKAYFYRNYNLAHVLADQDKIYVPSVSEVESGIFVESAYFIEQSRINPDTTPSPSSISTSSSADSKSKGININTGTKSELDSLKGIGSVTADKIIQNRPYATLDELVEKKVISANLLKDIRRDLSL